MERTDSYGGDYLRAEDLLYEGKFHTVNVTIEEVIPAETIMTAEKKKIPHPTLRFVGKRKMLVLCSKTNQRMIRYWSGQDLEQSAGTTITLQPRYVPFGNGKNAEMVLAIRVMPPSGTIMSKGLKKMLGEEAVWQAPPQPETTKKKPVADADKKPEPTVFEKLRDRLASKPIAELNFTDSIAYITKLNAEKTITDDEFTELGTLLTTRCAGAEKPE